MKINRSNFGLLLAVDCDSEYEGTFNVSYREKVFSGREVDIEDTAYISKTDRPLKDSELVTVNQINKLISKEFNKRGFNFDTWYLKHSPSSNENTLEINYTLSKNGDVNTIKLQLIEDTTICKKALSLSRSISKRLLRELK